MVISEVGGVADGMAGRAAVLEDSQDPLLAGLLGSRLEASLRISDDAPGAGDEGRAAGDEGRAVEGLE